MLANLKAKLVAMVFPCEKVLNDLFAAHAEASSRNREAHENFMRACAVPLQPPKVNR